MLLYVVFVCPVSTVKSMLVWKQKTGLCQSEMQIAMLVSIHLKSSPEPRGIHNSRKEL